MEIIDHTESAAHTVWHQLKKLDSLLNKFKVKKEEHAAKFGRLIIQDAGGRMKPINTFSSELRKVSHSNDYKGMNSDQVSIDVTICSILD
jgi:hypothetical protein